MNKVGSRYQVFTGKAEKTSGGLRKNDLKKNKQGRIVSKKVSANAKRNSNLGTRLQGQRRRRSTRGKRTSDHFSQFKDPPKIRRKRK